MTVPDYHGALESELTEIDEARSALRTAITHLNNTADKLRDAQGWGTFDTWLGGGLFSSWIKRDKIQDVDVRMRHLDESLASLRQELADVGVAPLGGVGIGELTMTLDVWFDNIFSDLMTQSKLRDASDRLHRVGTALVRLQTELDRRAEAITSRLGS